MRIVHITDLHVQVAPKISDLFGKRLLSTTNLYLLGRKSKFSEQSQRAAIQTALDAKPDAVIFTGDLTAQALDAEFSAARTMLQPILDSVPTVLMAGNHDTYVRESSPGNRMRELLGQWMSDADPGLHIFDEVAFLTLETCRAHPLSSGYAQPSQFAKIPDLVQKAEGRFLFLCLHYPLRGRHGEPYGPATRALANASQVESALAKLEGVGAILHGHEHHGFRTTLNIEAGAVPILNPGASGYAMIPEKDRTAHLNIYEVSDGALQSVERLRFDGQMFRPEPGGAYATGR